MRPFKRCRHRQEDNNRTDVRDIGWEGVDWIHVTQDRDLWHGNNHWIPCKAGSFLTS